MHNKLESTTNIVKEEIETKLEKIDRISSVIDNIYNQSIKKNT